MWPGCKLLECLIISRIAKWIPTTLCKLLKNLHFTPAGTLVCWGRRTPLFQSTRMFIISNNRLTCNQILIKGQNRSVPSFFLTGLPTGGLVPSCGTTAPSSGGRAASARGANCPNSSTDSPLDGVWGQFGVNRSMFFICYKRDTDLWRSELYSRVITNVMQGFMISIDGAKLNLI